MRSLSDCYHQQYEGAASATSAAPEVHISRILAAPSSAKIDVPSMPATRKETGSHLKMGSPDLKDL